MICGRCLAGTSEAVVLDGAALATPLRMAACSACVEKTSREVDELRRIFYAMVAGGIDRRIANDVMIAYQRSLEPRAM